MSIELITVDSALVLQATQTGDLYEAILIGLETVLTPTNLALIIFASLLGLLMGALPGLGGPITLALLIPVTFNMDTNTAIMVLAAALGGGAFGGSITAILLNTPGAAPNAATVFDGYPLARQGRANEAIAASAVSSACGALLGLLLVGLLITFIIPIALTFGSIEFFWLAILGLSIIAVATRGSVLSDLIAGAFGLMLAFHGLNTVTGTARFTWDIQYLFDGIQLIPVIIGLFAIAEMVSLTSKGDTISSVELVTGGKLKGIKSVFQNKGVFLRSSILGWLIGVVPGVGGTVANFVAYLQAKQSAANPASFGTGDIRGVIASESSNDAKDGGSMIPTLVLGIPGSASTAVLLGAFIIHGVTPGPALLEENLQLLFIIVFALGLSNITTSAFGLAFTEQIAKITRISTATMAPVILFIALLGTFVIRSNFGDVAIAAVFGLFGFWMMKFDISRVSIIIAMVLGPLAENNLHRAIQISHGDYSILFSRPQSILLIIALVVVLLLPVYRSVAASEH